jgi:putative ABC transport system permease protein
VRLALRELRRRFRKFLPTTAALALLVVLLLMLGGLLDGLFLGSTGALRSQDSQLAVFSDSARDSVIRSSIDPATREVIESVDGVAATYGFGVALVGARVPGETGIADAAVMGYEGNVDGVPSPPPPGRAWADKSLRADGVSEGDVVKAGPTRIPLEVVGFVSDSNFLQQGALWVEPGTWREVLAESRPGAAVDDGVFQTVWVELEPGADADAVARAIDDATGTTKTLTRDDAVMAIPGIKEQETTFTQIIGVTLFVSGLVVALFFALLTLERTAMLGVLKAVGASSGQLVTTLVTQTLLVTALAYAIGASFAFAMSLVIPPDVPITLTASRAVFVAVGVFVAALIGGAISLRRIIKIDPASAIGTGT